MSTSPALDLPEHLFVCIDHAGIAVPDLDAAIGYLHGLGLQSLVCQPPTLEQLFLEHYEDDLSALDARR